MQRCSLTDSELLTGSTMRRMPILVTYVCIIRQCRPIGISILNVRMYLRMLESTRQCVAVVVPRPALGQKIIGKDVKLTRRGCDLWTAEGRIENHRKLPFFGCPKLMGEERGEAAMEGERWEKGVLGKENLKRVLPKAEM
ncbi:hypothetical protein MTR67_051577 [Solanum verrucosum]|uniref:Uncharacterized protein n=1 Tax=Solanum verrucosum TaxID=315347 RepID=A0AAF0V4L6_SOLVR|nr:hypothetical protein MTR67_051577 [Solanum verrucosum]